MVHLAFRGPSGVEVGGGGILPTGGGGGGGGDVGYHAGW